MKSMRQLLQGYNSSKKIDDDDVIIEVLIRRGNSILLQPPKPLKDMVCQDCGGTRGETCWDDGRKAWLCANEVCLNTDDAITKERERKKYWKEFHQRLKEAENHRFKKSNQEWDGS